MEYRIPPGVEAVEKLEDFIVVNRLAPNTRIPSERDLCEMWGVHLGGGKVREHLVHRLAVL